MICKSECAFIFCPVVSYLPTLTMENFAKFVHSLASEVKNISDSLGMRTRTSVKIQTLDKKNSRFRTWVGEMEH